jgi:hypothetical protein
MTGQLHETDARATDDDFAAMGWDPWTYRPDEWSPPTNADWNDVGPRHLLTARLAWIICHKSKQEMIEAVKQMDETGSLIPMVEGFDSSIAFFQSFVAVLKRAQAQVFCAGATMESDV